MRFGSVRSDHQNDIRICKICKRRGGSTDTERPAQGDRCRRVSEPCTVVDIIRAEGCTHHSLEQIILFIGSP
jgi:hypothetical protein